MSLYRIISSPELCHYGIKDQKWYVRRFQNPDGTLTEEGKIRYRKQQDRERRKNENREIRAEKKEQRRTRARNTAMFVAMSIPIGIAIANAFGNKPVSEVTSSSQPTGAQSTVEVLNNIGSTPVSNIQGLPNNGSFVDTSFTNFTPYTRRN